jgi:hypothetical protein
MRTKLQLAILLLSMAASSCEEFNEFPPPGPTTPSIPPSQYSIAGHWEGVSDQGRPLRFDVSDTTVVVNGSLSIHHDCTGGRLVLKLEPYQAQVNGDSFTAAINWRVEEPNHYYVGRLSVSGRFEGHTAARGGFVNSVTDKYDDNLGVCPPASGSWDASRGQ